MTALTPPDRWIVALDDALRTVAGRHVAARPQPRPASAPPVDLDATERAEAAALMRVNHVGEVCAQALYQAQAFGARDARLRAHFEAQGRGDCSPLWAGQNTAGVRRAPAAEIVRALARGFAAA